MRLRAALIAPALATLLSAPAYAHGHGGGVVYTQPPFGPSYLGGSMGGWSGAWQPPYEVAMPAPQQVAPDGPPPQNRDEWLRECRRRLGDNGVGGAVLGGVLGGVAGNVIAGQGNRVLGTIAGAAVGAVAGAAIDKGEDKARVRDRCEAMLDAPQQPYGGYAGYGAVPYGYMMVPVMMVPVQGARAASKGECKETVTTTEYITYETRRSRHIPHRATTKRVKIVPDKRVPQ